MNVDENDSLKEDDNHFWKQELIVRRALDGLEDDKTTESAADAITQVALASGDRLMVAVVLARFEDFVRQGRSPPRAMLIGVSEAFARFKPGNTSMDEAFGIAQKRRGKPASLLRREEARTHARMVALYVSQGDALEVAVEKVSQNPAFGFGRSESQVKRNYFKYRKGN